MVSGILHFLILTTQTKVDLQYIFLFNLSELIVQPTKVTFKSTRFTGICNSVIQILSNHDVQIKKHDKYVNIDLVI